MRLVVLIIALVALGGCAPSSSRSARVAQPPAVDLVDEVWRIVDEHFFDPKLNGIEWRAAGARCRQRSAEAASAIDVVQFVNQMLAELATSHTYLYRRGEAKYSELLDIYRHALGDDLKRVIADGIVRYEPGNGHAGGAALIGAVPHEVFLETMRRSARVIKRGEWRLGYVRIESWAGQEYQDLLIELLNAEPLRSCDGLILDIRGGWGGANPEYITLFGPECTPPTLTMVGRDGKPLTIKPKPETFVPRDRQWRKPVVLLVDEGSRSGKEVFAYAFKEAKRGPIVGTRTAGAVVGGKPFLLRDGHLLSVAVFDIRVNGVRLEGVGVEPDVVIERGAVEPPSDADSQVDGAAASLVERMSMDG